MSLTQTRRSATLLDRRLQITMNGLAKRIKRVAFGMTNFRHWRVRVLLYAGQPDWSKLATVTP
jgi:hypothetical protein